MLAVISALKAVSDRDTAGSTLFTLIYGIHRAAPPHRTTVTLAINPTLSQVRRQPQRLTR